MRYVPHQGDMLKTSNAVKGNTAMTCRIAPHRPCQLHKREEQQPYILHDPTGRRPWDAQHLQKPYH
jgi:hypothetical protein